MAEKPQDTRVRNGGGAGPVTTEARPASGAAETGRAAEHSVAQATRPPGEAANEAAGAAARSSEHDTARPDDHAGRMMPPMQDPSRDLRTLFALAGAGRDGMQDVRDSISSLVEGVMRTNLRMMQELFSLGSPVSPIEVQQRFGVAYLDTLLDSTTMLLHATRRTAEQALRPLEERRREDGHAERHAPRGCVADVMATEVRSASPDDTVQHAAQLMRDTDAGTLPVGEGDRLVGMVSGRDVAVRLVAEGRDPRRTRVREVMTPDVRCVFADDDLGHAAADMAGHRMRHLPVVNRQQRLVGMVSLADLTRRGDDRLRATG